MVCEILKIENFTTNLIGWQWIALMKASHIGFVATLCAVNFAAAGRPEEDDLDSQFWGASELAPKAVQDVFPKFFKYHHLMKIASRKNIIIKSCVLSLLLRPKET